jgi:hypothetical protein
MIIQDLAKKCQCDPATVRKWIKANNKETYLTKSFNNKMVQTLTETDCQQFSEYWIEITTFPTNMITVGNVAEQNKVDRKTVRLWAEKNNVKLHSFRSPNGPPMQAMTIDDAGRFKNEYSSAGYVPILEIVSEYNTNQRVIKRWASKNNCEFVKMKSNKGGRSKICLKKHDYENLEKYLMEMKSEGFFYMLQPVPEFNVNRIKLGFSKKFSRRLKEHRTICPNATLIKKWKCHKDDERKTTNDATQNSCIRLYTEDSGRKSGSHATEVFDCTDYKIVLERLDQIFKDRHEQSIAKRSSNFCHEE